MKPRITYFDEYHTNGGWIWGVEADDSITGAPTVTQYRTNSNSEGLWIDGQQRLGTTQYRLDTDRKKARAQVYRQYVRNEGEL